MDEVKYRYLAVIGNVGSEDDAFDLLSRHFAPEDLQGIVSGEGQDRYAQELALRLTLPIKVVPLAKSFGQRARSARNIEMANLADGLLVVGSVKSLDVTDCITRFQYLKKKVVTQDERN